MAKEDLLEGLPPLENILNEVFERDSLPQEQSNEGIQESREQDFYEKILIACYDLNVLGAIAKINPSARPFYLTGFREETTGVLNNVIKIEDPVAGKIRALAERYAGFEILVAYDDTVTHEVFGVEIKRKDKRIGFISKETSDLFNVMYVPIDTYRPRKKTPLPIIQRINDSTRFRGFLDEKDSSKVL